MKTRKILAILLLALGMAGTAFADLPEGWRHNYIYSSEDPILTPSGGAEYDPVTQTWTVNCGRYALDVRIFHYVYTDLSGDGQITARILSTNSTAFVAVRDGLAYSSKHAGSYIGWSPYDPHGWAAYFYCTGILVGPENEHRFMGPPYWVRLKREGNMFTGYISPDGSNWTPVGAREVPMSTNTHIGIAVVGNDSIPPSKAEFDSVLVEPLPSDDGWEVSGDNMYSAVEGNVGIGTTSPLEKLHVSGGDILLDNNQYISFIDDSGYINQTLTMDNNDDLVLLNFSGGSIVFCTTLTRGQATSRIAITNSGNVGIGTLSPQGKLDVNGSIYQRGGRLHADYVFKPGYELESIDEHSHFMWQHGHLEAIPKAQVDCNGQEILEVGAHRKGIVEELEKAHIYIEQLNNRIKALEEKLAKLEAELTTKQ